MYINIYKKDGIPAIEVVPASGDCPATVSVQWRLHHQGAKDPTVEQLSSRWHPGKKLPIRHGTFLSRVSSSVCIHKNTPHLAAANNHE